LASEQWLIVGCLDVKVGQNGFGVQSPSIVWQGVLFPISKTFSCCYFWLRQSKFIMRGAVELQITSEIRVHYYAAALV
jgi:hypothetical protein